MKINHFVILIADLYFCCSSCAAKLWTLNLTHVTSNVFIMGLNNSCLKKTFIWISFLSKNIILSWPDENHENFGDLFLFKLQRSEDLNFLNFTFCHCTNSGQIAVIVLWPKQPRFESWLRHSFFSSILPEDLIIERFKLGLKVKWFRKQIVKPWVLPKNERMNSVI